MVKFEMLSLPYAYNALEPFLDAKTMEIHYSKHYKTYTDNLNKLVQKDEQFFDEKSLNEILIKVEEIPQDIRQDVIDQGGGYINHTLYWKSLSPNGGGEAMGALGQKIAETYGSFEEMKKLMSQISISQFGSGWGWLVLNEAKELEILKTLNQNTPLSLGKVPLLLIDVWEHAYYLKYQNRRVDFVEAIWNVINWDEVEKRYEEAIKIK